MTAGQLLIEQGRQQGREEGRQEGREESRQVLQELLISWIRQRFGGAVDAAVERRIAAGSVDQIKTWAGRVLSAATLSELLAD